MKRIRDFRIVAPVAGLAAVLAWQAWTPAAMGFPSSRGGGHHKAARLQSSGAPAYHEETRTKIVPILSLGEGIRIGIAQVAGPVSRVGDVKAVAQLQTEYKKEARINLLVPIATEHIISNVKRVPQVSVTGFGQLKL